MRQSLLCFDWEYGCFKDVLTECELFFVLDAQANAGEGVRLVDYTGDKIDLSAVRTITDCIQLAANPDVVADMEDLLTVWCKQIEQVHCSALYTVGV